jgi:teichuronic acid biosynthesis glycosyltransferase TuaH
LQALYSSLGMKLTNQNILILSNEPWGEIWYSKQNYAYELSKSNRVYFIDPPKHWKLKNLFYNPITIKQIKENLYVIDYQNFLPLVSNIINLLNNYIVSKYLSFYLWKHDIKKYIFWSFDPLRLFNPSLFKAKFSIYHCVDLFFFKYIGERILTKNANLVLGNSTILLNEYIEFKKPMALIEHAISSEEFTVSEKEQANFDLNIDNYGLYIGVIDERIDFSWVEEAVKNHPDQNFVFVGPLRYPSSNPAAVRLFGNQKSYSNVIAIGPRHFKSLKNYVKKAKFCISFMDKNYPGNTIAHHKTLIYLAQGKPVFGYAFTEYELLKEIMYMSEKSEEVLEMLKNFLINGERDIIKDKRILFAQQFTFEETFKKIELFINKIL